MSSPDLRKITSVHCYCFLRVIRYIVKMRRKRIILFNSGLAKKIQKHMKLYFNPRKKERKKSRLNIYFVIGKTETKTIAELKLGSRRGQPGSGPLYGKKSNFEK